MGGKRRLAGRRRYSAGILQGRELVLPLFFLRIELRFRQDLRVESFTVER